MTSWEDPRQRLTWIRRRIWRSWGIEIGITMHQMRRKKTKAFRIRKTKAEKYLPRDLRKAKRNRREAGRKSWETREYREKLRAEQSGLPNWSIVAANQSRGSASTSSERSAEEAGVMNEAANSECGACRHPLVEKYQSGIPTLAPELFELFNVLAVSWDAMTEERRKQIIELARSKIR